MIIKGKTLKAALLEAENKTGKKIDEIVYEIIENKKGMFRNTEIAIEIRGFKNRTKVKMENGRVVFNTGELPASITPGEHIVIKVNGNTIIKKTIVREEDQIIINTLDTQASREIKFSISEDKMEAYAEVSYVPQSNYKVKDSDYAENLIIDAELVEEVPTPVFKLDEFEEALREQNIKIGIQWDNVKRVLNGGKELIARGVKPVEPENDRIEYFFDIQNEKKPLEIEGKVDYYNIGKIDFVEEGKILAVRSEGRDGKAGLDVFGNHLLPAKRQILKILKGTGCEVVDNGNRAISLIKGMPSIKSERVCVFPGHLIEGDVDLKTGNIDFEGDVIVKGNVTEGLKVTAGNNITITGDVINASIVSGGDISIGKSIIGSKLIAGSSQLMNQEGLEHLKKLESFLERFLRTIKQIENTGIKPGNYSIGHVVKVILESKYQDDKRRIIEGFKFLKTPGISPDIVNLWSEFYDVYRDIIGGTLNDTGILETFIKTIGNFIVDCEIKLSPASVTIGYSQNSEISSTKDVEIKGKGCYSTNIHAQNEVRAKGIPGVFRGGEIIAPKGIHLRECGSSAGVRTLLKTSKNGVIEIETAYQNTLLYFDELIYKLDFPAKKLKAYVNKGEIVVEKLKL